MAGRAPAEGTANESASDSQARRTSSENRPSVDHAIPHGQVSKGEKAGKSNRLPKAKLSRFSSLLGTLQIKYGSHEGRSLGSPIQMDSRQELARSNMKRNHSL